ncbi:hypothetical protein BCR36DRAFT_409156, partial [Piromyces finnis]
MIYTKKELYSLLSDIENKVNDNIRRNTQENLINDNGIRNIQENIVNNKRNTQEINENENIKHNQENIINKQNIRQRNIKELKESLFKDSNVKESYNKIKNELPVNELPLDTMFDFMDGTRVRLTHPYSFSNKNKHNFDFNEENQLNKQFQTNKFQNVLFKDQNNSQNHINNGNLINKDKEYKPINFKSSVNKNENLNNIFSNYRHRNTYSTKKTEEEPFKKENVNFESFKRVSEINKTQKEKNEEKKHIQADEIERIQQKLKEFLFEIKIFLMLILFRFYNSLSLGTFFVPDEYWQSIEVAHNFVFDYGYLTWEWKEKIRSFSYPLLFTIPYMILKHLNLDNTDLIIYFPRIIHVFIAAFCDLYTYKLTKKYFGRNAAKWALFCSMLSWSNWNILVRTISNSIETTLTVMALYYWPLRKPKDNNDIPINDFMISLILAAIACFFRPTNGIIWVFLGLSLLFQYRKSLKTLLNIIYHVLIVLVTSLIISIGIDKFYFDEWVISPWNFIKFNIIENISIFYGDNSWHWYFSCGLPFVGYTFLIFMIPGVITSHFNILFYLLLWTVGVYSNLVHKEYRFIYPIVPIIFFYSGHFLDLISKYDQKIKSFIKKYIWKSVALLVLTNIPLAFYIANVHQRGVMDATYFLRKEVRQHDANGIMYLMPCHSTPFYSYIHKNITLDFLTCEPPIGEKDIKAYKSEEDYFFEDPKYFLYNHFSHTIGNTTIKYPTDGKYAKPPENIPKKEWSNYIVFFDNIHNDIKFIFENSNYKEVKRYFNSHFNIKKRKGDIIIYSNI